MPVGSVTARNALLTATVGDSRGISIPATLYLAFSDNDPTGSHTEVTDVPRVAVPMSSSMWASPSLSQCLSLLTISTAAAAWAISAGWVALYDNASHGSGNLWHYGALSAPVHPTGAGDVVAFAPGNLAIVQA